MKIFKKIFYFILRISVSIALLIFLFKQVDRKSLFEIIKNADKGFLFLAFFIYFFAYFLCLLRWEMLLRAVKIHLSLKRVVISFSGGVFFSLFLPSTIGGDLVRSVDLATHTKRPREVVATVLLDRLSGYAGLVIMALLALLAGGRLIQHKSVIITIMAITGLLAVILLVLFNPFCYARVNQFLHSPSAGRVREAIRNLHHEMHLFRHHEGVLVKNVMLSFMVQVSCILTFYFTALAIGVHIKLIYFILFIPLIGAITMLPLSIGGLGLRDATTIFFFTKVAMTKDMAFAMSLVNFFFILAYAGIGGIIYVLTVHHRRLQHHPSPHIQKAPA